MFDEVISTVSYKEIPDCEIRSKVEKLLSVSSTEELRHLWDSEEYNFRFDAGCSMATSTITVADKHTIVNDLSTHYVVYYQKAALDQLKSGLSTLDVLQLMQKYPKLLKPLFLASGKKVMNAADVLDIFTVEWSPSGSNQREEEEAVILQWTEYVQEIEGGRLVMNEEDSAKSTTVTIETIMCFATGADHIPPLGFELQPTIKFNPDKTRLLPVASTCSLCLYFSLGLQDCETFAKNMDMALVCAHGFGNP